jgi:hypothetical protein
MRRGACRQWGLGAVEVCRGPANTTIVSTAIMASPHACPHDCQRFHAALSAARVDRPAGPRARRVLTPPKGRRGMAPAACIEALAAPRPPCMAKIRSRALRGSSSVEGRSRPAACRHRSRWRAPQGLEAVENELRSEGSAVQVRRKARQSIRRPFGAGHCAAVCLADQGCRLIQEDGRSAASGWLRRPGG